MLAKPHSPAPEVSTSLSSSQFHAEESRGCVIVSALELRRRCINYKRSERSLKSGTCNDSRLRPGFGYPRLLWISCAVKRGDVDSNVVSSVTMSDEVIVESEQGGVVGEADRDRESKQEAGEENWFSTCQKARLYLLLVPFLWGTYGPALRFIYSQPLAPSASIITLSRKVASVGFFLLLQPLEKSAKSNDENYYGAATSVNEAISGSSWSAAAELGFWTFLGTALQTSALGSTTAIRAGFILQIITVLVPLISAVSGSHVSKTTWGSAILALTGVVLMSVFGNEGATSGSISSLLCSEGSVGCQSALIGDLQVLAAAFFFAINTIRLGVHAKKTSALELSTRVMVVSTAFSFVWAGYDYVTVTLEGRDGGLAWQGLASPEVVSVTIFAALVPGTLAHLAQAVGQKTIPPSEAQVYYSLQPVWGALFSAILLHESMTPLAWGAGCVIVFAALLAGSQDS